MNPVAILIEEGARQLRQAGIEGARKEARMLLEQAAGIPRSRQLGFPETRVETVACDRYQQFIRRRAAREPMSQILGRREFWSLDFLVSDDVLDPRPDSEILIEATLASINDKAHAYRILDFGTGTGCLLLALLSELPKASGIGVDCSVGAMELASRNAKALGLSERSQFLLGDWDHNLDPGWDIIVANPPYIPTVDIDELEPEVAKFEPRVALDGGADGLAHYRRLLPAARRLLVPGGIASFEVGAGQMRQVIELGTSVGLAILASVSDLAGRPRCAVFGRSINLA